MEANRRAVLEYEGLLKRQRGALCWNLFSLLPAAANRLKEC